MRKSICINAENAENAMKINAQTDLQFGKLLWSIRHNVNLDIFSIVNLISVVVACLNKFQHWMVWYIYVTNGQENVNVESSMLFLSYLYYDHLLKPSPVLPWFLTSLQSLSPLNHWCPVLWKSLFSLTAVFSLMSSILFVTFLTCFDLQLH